MAGRWPSAADPYGGRGSRKWGAHFTRGGKVTDGTDFKPIGDGKSKKHPAGKGDVSNSYLTGHAGGEAHPQYHRTTRKRTPADYGTRTPKPERGIP